MNVIEWSPDELGERAALLPLTIPTQPLFTGDQMPADDPGFWDAASAAFERENLAWNALKAVGRVTGNEQIGQQDPNWNPYAYMRRTWDSERYGELMPYIDQGLFEDALTPEMVELKAEAILGERRLIRNAESSFAGSLAGGLAAAITDPTSYIPVGGWLMTGGRLLRVGKLALHGAATGLLQEAGLHQFQDLRTVRESLMNIGSQTVLAGGFGAFSYGLSSTHPLNPGHPVE